MTWPTVTLADVAQGGLFTDGDWVESKDQDPGGGVRLTQLADVGVAEFRNRSDRWLREDQASRLNCTFLEPRDLLIARMPDPIGRACLAPSSIGRAVTAVDVAVLRIGRDDVLPEYAMWAINSPDFRSRVEALQSGTTRKRISRKNLASLTILVPPLREQRRIVDILEDHLARLDAADRYVSSAMHRLDGVAESTLRELLANNNDDRALGELLEIPLSNGRSVPTRDDGFPVLRLTALKDRGVDLRERKGGDWVRADARRFLVSRGDFLIARGNGSLRLLGRGSLVRDDPDEVAYPDTAIRARAARKVMTPEFLDVAWNSTRTRVQIEEMARTTAGIYKVNQKQLAAVRLPVPSMADQGRIVGRMAEIDEQAGRSHDAFEHARTRGAALRRGLLAAAFSGKLTGRHTDQEVIKELVDESVASRSSCFSSTARPAASRPRR